MTTLEPKERRAAAAALRRTVQAVDDGEVEGDEFTRGYLLGAADTIDPTTRSRQSSPAVDPER